MNNEANEAVNTESEASATPFLDACNKSNEVLNAVIGFSVIAIITFPFIGAFITALREALRPVFSIH